MTSPNHISLAECLKTDPQEVERWVQEGQLRLLAATLTDLVAISPTRSREHRLADIEAKLKPLVEQTGAKWGTWWSKVQPWVKESDYFQFNKTGNTGTYRLADRIVAGDIPVKRLVGKPKTAGTGDSSGSSSNSLARKSATKSSAGRDLPEWVRWLWAKDDAPLPGTTPPDGLATLLETCPEEIIEQVMSRLLSGIAEALNTPRLTPKAKDQWLELITKAHRRRQEVPGQESTGATARRTPKVLAQLTDAFEQQARIQPLLAQIGPVVNTDQHWRQEFARGVWDTFQSNRATAETLLKRLASTLDDKQQVALWGDVLTAAFAAPSYPNRAADVNRVIGWLKADQQAATIHRLILQAALLGTAESDVATFVAESRYAGQSSGPEKLNALVTAGLLLQERRDNFITEVSGAYKAALIQNKVWGISLMDALLKASRSHIDGLNQQWQGKLDEHEVSFSEARKQWQDENSHLNSQLRALRAEMVSGRKKSNLEVRSGMLLHIGDILQGAYQVERSPESRLNDVMERLPMVLNDGDTELFGTVGSIVRYDRKFHHTAATIPSGSLVRIIAPGIIIKDTPLEDNDPVLLKATVTPEGQED